MSGKLNDKFLLASAIAGDEEAFGKIYDKYVDEIFRFALMRLNTKEEAQDIASEAFLKAWQYITLSEKRVDNIRALLYRIARNLIIDNYRSRGKEVQAFDQKQFEELVDLSFNLEESVLKKDDIREVFSVLDDLPEESRDLVMMRYSQDLGISEIADILGKNSGAIRVALHRAIKQLKSILKKKQLCDLESIKN